MLRSFFQLVRLPAYDLESVHPRGCARGVSYAATNDLQRRILKIDDAAGIVITEAQGALRTSQHTCFARGYRAAGNFKFRRFRGGVVSDKHGVLCLPGIHAVNEALAP